METYPSFPPPDSFPRSGDNSSQELWGPGGDITENI